MNAFLWFLLPITFMVFIFGIDSLERKRKGNKTMSQFLKEMIGKKPTIMSESIGTNNWLVVDVDEEWVKLSMTDKKGQTKTKLIRIEDIRSIEL
ncbi:hypothetical protein K1J09_08130 [Streptococcus sanguinis]|nr:hypothetical protein [Streptococcus sanguinis]MBZ2048365.1 hypothetical protein [Streptococcus sanguinis]MBZ2051207.1 hypothetical protein [Streptococcus sanguinis]MBZ2059801.1 hypothetical protein [Streptococcus sanguinis]MCC3177249.1 putative aspartyl-tRNA synthetase [Streptococcus sanguinis]